MNRVLRASIVALVAGGAGLAVFQASGCVPAQPSGAQAPPPTAGGAAASQVTFAPPLPPAPPPSPRPANMKTGNVYSERFLELWTELHDLSNGYFSPEGVPYHSVETLLVEAPDHGHETTSEAFSYYIWLEAMYGKVTGDYSHLDRAWKTLEYYIIPKTVDQPTNRHYPPNKPATFAEERDTPNEYPPSLDGSVIPGKDPIADELKRTYGTPDLYVMHWLLDVDNFYGYGNRGDGTSRVSYINTFQRGAQESCWETIPHPSWEEFKWGQPGSGFLGLFVNQPNPAKQWRYTAAPDADARAVQALYWAKRWADEAGGNPTVDALMPKGAMMGDMIRYAFFDKYFKTVPCTDRSCPPGKGYESAMFLINWYFAWGGSMPQGGFGWAWRIGSSHNHQAYQNPMAAYALSGAFQPLTPRSPNGARDWGISLQRQLEMYRWLQSKQGGIAAGCTNSWKGRYEAPPPNTATFYGMAYDESPVYLDPPSNEWFGFQVWPLERVAEYYYVTGDPKAEVVISRWAKWAMANTIIKKDSYEVPSTMKWSGQPARHWNQISGQDPKLWDAKDANYNSTLEVKVTSHTADVGLAAGMAHTLLFYAARSQDQAAKKMAKDILDRMWQRYRDDLGVASPGKRGDYKRFGQKVYVPAGWTGKMANGDPIDQNSTFISIRSKYRQDPAYPRVAAYVNGTGPAPEFTYHRFWDQAHIALAYATYAWLFPDDQG